MLNQTEVFVDINFTRKGYMFKISGPWIKKVAVVVCYIYSLSYSSDEEGEIFYECSRL